MKKLSFLVFRDALKLFFYAHCMSHFNYASTIWCNASDVHIKKLNMLHKRGVKILLPDSNLNTLDKYKKLRILLLQKQFLFNVAITMFQIANKNAPNYLLNLFDASNFNRRFHHYPLPLPRIDLFKTSLSFWGAQVWNSLPVSCQNSTSLSSFKLLLRKHLLS